MANTTAWDTFFKEKMIHVTATVSTVVDIGGGLRALPNRGNRFDPRRAWLQPHLEKIDYKVLDPVATYHPDIVGDIHDLPLADNSQEALVCLAVLEHVEDPWQAMREIHRVLKPGGMCLLYVPFLFYYHAETGYYHDYWRFTEDSLRLLAKPFASVEICSVRGALETWLHISPLGRFKLLVRAVRWADRITGKAQSKQVSGYYAFVKK